MMTGVDGATPQPATRGAGDRKPPWRPARFASVVVEELAESIISGALAEGDVLPTEPALCNQFGFSRTVIREALKMLEERGLVRVEQGRGTTVQPRDAWNLLDPLVLGIALSHDVDMSLLENLVAVPPRRTRCAPRCGRPPGRRPAPRAPRESRDAQPLFA